MNGFDLSKNTKIKISGPESLEMLNNLVSNDLTKLEKGKAMHCAFLNRFGKVEADTWIYNFGDYYLVEANEIQRDRLLSLIKKYGALSKVEILDETNTKLFHVFEKIENSFERKRTGEIGYDVFSEIPGIEILSNEILDAKRIEDGILEYGKDVDDKTLVVEGGFDDAISYEKGCYVGQEVVSRMRTFKGKTLFVIEKFIAEGDIKPGDKVMKNGNEVGIVTSAFFENGKTILIARVKTREGISVNGVSLRQKSF